MSLRNEIKWFLQQKTYIIALFITSVCCYGFSIIHPAIGIDDTMRDIYIEEGLEAVMGRWVLFLLNKVFPFSNFSPFITEFLGMLLLMAAATLFCVFFRRIFGESIDLWGYTVFACLFVSCPIISEADIFYLHNGIELGYILTALSLLSWLKMSESSTLNRKKLFFAQVLFLWIAIGCYETFIIVYLVGIILILFLQGWNGQRDLSFSYLTKKTALCGLTLCFCILMRTLMNRILIALFHLDSFGYDKFRSLSETMAEFNLAELTMLIKRYFLQYIINGLVYLPAATYTVGMIFFGIIALVLTWKKRNGWFLLLFAGMGIIPLSLTLAEFQVPYYRTCQYLPFFAASAALFAIACISSCRKRYIKGLKIAFYSIMLILIYNQAFMMNYNFYMDYCKYENAKDIMTKVAFQVEETYGTELPLIFTGHYKVPYEFQKQYYLPYDSPKFKVIAFMADLLDKNLKEKYYTDYGYSFVGEADYSVIDWGINVFGEQSVQLARFLEMHGHSFSVVTDPSVIEQAVEYGKSMPRWPADDSIVQRDNYILIHF